MNENYPGYERRSSTWLREISAKFLKLYLLHIHLGQQALSEVSILVVLDLLAHDRVRDSFVQEHLLVEAHRLELLRQHQRSEEHTSELQSLMRISYAVFCLKKKKADCSSINTISHFID